MGARLALVRPIPERVETQGRVIWITGLSGAGKTSVARDLVQLLRVRIRPVLLDGDVVREVLGDPSVGYDSTHRLINAYRICRLARMLAGQGFTVVVSTMSLYREIHEWNRNNMPNYFEVYLRVDMEVLRARDPKGLYARAAQGIETSVAGVDIGFEEPRRSNLVIENDGSAGDVASVAEIIMSALEEHA